MASDLLFGQIAFGAGYRTAAVALIRELQRSEPASAEANFLLCAMLLKLRDAGAQDQLLRCATAHPGLASGWNTVGQALRDLGQREAALVCFARAQPGFENALQRGLIARDLGRSGEARTCFAEAVRSDRQSVRAWFLLGTAAQDAGDLDAAAAAYRTVLHLDPARAEAAVNLGTVLQEGGDLAAAKDAYARAVSIRGDTFGRVAQALATPRTGELWLDLAALRRSLER